MNKNMMKFISQVLVVAFIIMLLPTGLSASAVTGTITNITANPNRPVANTNNNEIRVAPVLSANGNFTYGDRSTMTFAHMGSRLKGKTQIYVPVNDSTRSNPTPPGPTTNVAMQNFLFSTQEYFNFTANQPGAVIVVSSINLHNQIDTSKYKNNYASWTCVANGVAPTLPNDYTDLRLVPIENELALPYYFTRYQWLNATLCSSGSPLAPDLNLQKSNQVSSNFSSAYKFSYAYKKFFAADTPVSIPVVGNFQNNENIMTFVDWDDVEPENAKLNAFTYTTNEDTQTVTGFTPTDEGGTYNVVLPLGTTSVSMNTATAATLANITQNPGNGIVDVSSGSGSYTVTVVSGSLTNTYTVNFTMPKTYSVNLSAGSGGTVTSTPANATVQQGQTVEFTITPNAGYEIGSVLYDGNPVLVVNGIYTTPPLTKNVNLVVNFVQKEKTPPAISIVDPFHGGRQTFNGTSPRSGKQVNMTIESSFLSYATIANPDKYPLTSFGIYLKDVATGKVIELPVLYKTNDGQFAVQVYGSGFENGKRYSLQGYLNYVDDLSSTKLVLSEAVKLFDWVQ